MWSFTDILLGLNFLWRVVEATLYSPTRLEDTPRNSHLPESPDIPQSVCRNTMITSGHVRSRLRTFRWNLVGELRHQSFRVRMPEIDYEQVRRTEWLFFSLFNPRGATTWPDTKSYVGIAIKKSLWNLLLSKAHFSCTLYFSVKIKSLLYFSHKSSLLFENCTF